MRKLFLSLFIAVFFLTTAEGEAQMNNFRERLFEQTDRKKINKVVDELIAFYNWAQSGDIAPDEVSEKLFTLIKSNVVEAALIFDSFDIKIGGIRTEHQKIFPEDLYIKIRDQVKPLINTTSNRITPTVFGASDPSIYLRYITEINAALFSKGVLQFSKNNVVDIDEFLAFSYFTYVFADALGYHRPDMNFDRTEYWPDQMDFKGQVDYIHFFRTSEIEKSKSNAFTHLFESLSYDEKVGAYAWVYYVSFEEFLVVGETPSDLPPWINSNALRALHKEINDQVMEDFRKEEEEMLGG